VTSDNKFVSNEVIDSTLEIIKENPKLVMSFFLSFVMISALDIRTAKKKKNKKKLKSCCQVEKKISIGNGFGKD